MMKLHTINYVKLYGAGDARLLLRFDDDARLELSDMVDLSPMLARGGVFEPLRDPSVFHGVEIGPRGRTLTGRLARAMMMLSTCAPMRSG